MLRTALISGSPLLRAGLAEGLAQLGSIDLVLCRATLAQARAEGYAGAEVAIVDAARETELPGDAESERDGPALVLLLGQPDGRLAGWLAQGVTLLNADASIEAIAAAAQASAAGLVACPPKWAAHAARMLAAPLERTSRVLPFEPLTRRELEVLWQMSAGLGNREIAEALHISTHTAKFHVAQIIAKLDASSRGHAVAKALRAGLVDPVS